MTKVWYWTDEKYIDSDNFPSMKDAVNNAAKEIVKDNTLSPLSVYEMMRIGGPSIDIEAFERPQFVLKVTVDDINADGSLKRKLSDEGWQD